MGLQYLMDWYVVPGLILHCVLFFAGERAEIPCMGVLAKGLGEPKIQPMLCFPSFAPGPLAFNQSRHLLLIYVPREESNLTTQWAVPFSICIKAQSRGKVHVT